MLFTNLTEVIVLVVVCAVAAACFVAALVLLVRTVRNQKRVQNHVSAPLKAEEPVGAGAEAVTTEEATTEEAATEEAATVDVPFFANDTPRLKKSFTAKLIQSSDEVKERYSQLKNAFLRYKRTNSRVSWQADSINCGRKMLGKFVIRGKTLCLYLALDPDDYAGTKYKVDRAAGKRYERVPCRYRIISARRAKYAPDLIAAVAAKYSLAPIEREAVDYRPAYEETQPLVARGLIRAGK